jgi:hypothetical protein
VFPVKRRPPNGISTLRRVVDRGKTADGAFYKPTIVAVFDVPTALLRFIAEVDDVHNVMGIAQFEHSLSTAEDIRVTPVYIGNDDVLAVVLR